MPLCFSQIWLDGQFHCQLFIVGFLSFILRDPYQIIQNNFVVIEGNFPCLNNWAPCITYT